MNVEELQARVEPYKVKGMLAVRLTTEEWQSLRNNTPMGVWMTWWRGAMELGDPQAVAVIWGRLVILSTSNRDPIDAILSDIAGKI